MEILIAVFVFVVGLCLGSFINMLVYRVAINYKLESRNFKIESKNRSFCDFCGRQLRWYENVPIISWIFLGGKTGCCHKKLPVLYPIVELVTGLLMILISFKFNLFNFDLGVVIFCLRLFWGMLLMTLLIFLTVFDLKYMILPDFAVIILIVISFFGVVFDEPNILPYLWSAIGAGVFLGMLYLITKKRGIGFGDVKLAVFMGLFLGWPKIIVAIYVAFIVGAIVGLVGMVLGKLTKKSRIPFGPFLILGTIIAWIFGSQVISWLGIQFVR